MKYLDLQTKISANIFTFSDVLKAFHSEDEQSIKVQLSRFTQKGLIVSLRKGIYKLISKLGGIVVPNQIVIGDNFESLGGSHK